jgi:hypothetical protein
MPAVPRGQVHLEPLRAFVRREEGLPIEMDLGDEDILHVSFEVPVVSDAIDHAIPEQLILPGVPRLDESTVLLFAMERTEVGNLVSNAVCYQWRYGLRWEPFCESAHRYGRGHDRDQECLGSLGPSVRSTLWA